MQEQCWLWMENWGSNWALLVIQLPAGATLVSFTNPLASGSEAGNLSSATPAMLNLTSSWNANFLSLVPVWPSAILQLFVWRLCASRHHILIYLVAKPVHLIFLESRCTKTMWRSRCLQPCVVRLQSPLWTPLAAAPGDPSALHWTKPTLKTQAHIPRGWSGSGEEGIPCQN